MTLSIIENALGRSRNLKVRGIDDMSDVLVAAQRVVDTLTPPQGGRYIVALKEAKTASTDYGTHRIVITSKPLRDSSLTQAQVAEIIVGLTAHEIGHTIFDGIEMARIIKKRNPHPAYHKCHNVLADIRLERRMSERFPMIRPAFLATGRWIAKWYRYENKGALTATPTMKSLARFNFGLAATRYPGGVKWSADPLTRAERRRWQEWAATYTADDSLELHLAGVDAAWEMLNVPSTPEPEPEDEIEDEPEIDEPERITEPGEDLDDDDDDTDEGEPLGEDDDEDGEDSGDWGDEDFKDEPEGKPEDDDADRPSGTDEDDESEDEPTDTDNVNEGEPGGEPEDDDTDDESDPDVKGGGKDATDDPWEDWDDTKVQQDTHDKAEREPGQEGLATEIETFDHRTKVTFGAFGSMTAQWWDK